MGATYTQRGARPPSHVAYYVAMAGIMGLLLLLCCYFLYFCIRRVKELSELDSLSQVPTSSRPPPRTTAYPVQQEVRDGATALAQLCKQLPGAGAGAGSADKCTEGVVVLPAAGAAPAAAAPPSQGSASSRLRPAAAPVQLAASANSVNQTPAAR